MSELMPCGLLGGRFAPVLLLFACLGHCPATALADEYAVGADLSFLAQAEQSGRVFTDNGVAKPGLELFKDHGYNWIRLRLFHSPTELPNDLDYTIALANDAKQRGFKFLLNYHYSDTWADPQKQFLPHAWEGMSHDELEQAVFEYTRDTMVAFRAAGVAPDMVQIGNEVIGGMLWPDGRLPKNWENFADLLKAGIRGVDAGLVDADGRVAARPKIMIHIDRGGDRGATESFLNHCRQYGVEYDVIGQSYYPWWHGSLDNLRDNLAFMANEYDKDIMLVEVAYNWRRAEYRDEPGPFPETPAGQRQFLTEVDRIVRATPHGRGKGIFWWEPAVSRGPIASRGMFDDEGNALPVLTVFDEPIRVASPASGE
ncbi:MAG: glycosyl hydrolase 53 family protein [Pirellulales bacterium]